MIPFEGLLSATAFDSEDKDVWMNCYLNTLHAQATHHWMSFVDQQCYGTARRLIEVQADSFVKLVAVYHAGGNFGKLVLWCFTIQLMSQRLERKVTIKDLTEQFPDGLPTDNACRDIWYSQKSRHLEGDSTNILDYDEHWDNALKTGYFNIEQ